MVKKKKEAITSANVDIDCQAASKKIPIGIAARYGHIDVVRLLPDHGANAVIVDK